MRNNSFMVGSAAIILAGAALSPAYAYTHRHMHSALHQESTPAERQQTADLNRQQLSGASISEDASGMNAGASATEAAPQNGLATEPTSYQKSGSSAAPATSSPSTAGGQGIGEDQSVGAKDRETMGNPGGAATPPTTTNPGTP